MHYHVEVWIPGRRKVEREVETALAPFDENHGRGQNGFSWDWYQIGGRWKGAHDPTYEPEKDPAHVVTCDLCSGTGRRPDAEKFGAEWIEWSKGCNGCLGKGKRVSWPTGWEPHVLDVVPTGKIPKGLKCHTFVYKGKAYPVEVFEYDENDPKKSRFRKTKFDGTVAKIVRRLGIKGGKIVTVDCHS